MAPPSRHLVITADDMGYCRERDEGIVHCYKAKVITRSSLMMNGTSTDTAAAMAKEIGLPVGLHLNMTEGSPVSPRADIPSLLNSSGYFHDKTAIGVLLTAGKINLNEVVIEIQSQLKKFEQLMGHLPPYVDGHQHVHILPGIAEVFASILNKMSIQWTRLPVEDTDNAPWVEAERTPFFIKISDLSKLAKNVFSANNIRFTDYFVGMMMMGKHLNVERIQAALSKVFQLKDIDDAPVQMTQTDDVTRSCELMVHPGYPCTSGIGGCGEGPDEFAKSTDRTHEIGVLQSELLKVFFKEHNIELSPFPA